MRPVAFSSDFEEDDVGIDSNDRIRTIYRLLLEHVINYEEL